MDPTTAVAGSIGKILEVYGAAGAIGILAGIVIGPLALLQCCASLARVTSALRAGPADTIPRCNVRSA